MWEWETGLLTSCENVAWGGGSTAASHKNWSRRSIQTHTVQQNHWCGPLQSSGEGNREMYRGSKENQKWSQDWKKEECTWKVRNHPRPGPRHHEVSNGSCEGEGCLQLDKCFAMKMGVNAGSKTRSAIQPADEHNQMSDQLLSVEIANQMYQWLQITSWPCHQNPNHCNRQREVCPLHLNSNDFQLHLNDWTYFRRCYWSSFVLHCWSSLSVLCKAVRMCSERHQTFTDYREPPGNPAPLVKDVHPTVVLAYSFHFWYFPSWRTAIFSN